MPFHASEVAVIYAGSASQIIGQLTLADGPGNCAPLPGVLVRIEMQAAGAQCDVEGWTVINGKPTGTDGFISYEPPSAARYRLTLIPPIECASSACVLVP
jgi:hypothetical protein